MIATDVKVAQIQVEGAKHRQLTNPINNNNYAFA